MIFKNSKLIVQDNFGIKKVKCIKVPKKGYAILGAIVLISVLKKISLKKKIKYGQLFRALITNNNSINFRKSGFFVKGFNSVVIPKKIDNVPISKRIKGPLCVESRKKKLSRVLLMSSYIF